MSFATDFEIGFSTKRALRDKKQLDQALESLARKAEKTGKRMDRALGRGAAQATRNLKGVAKSINRASTATQRMERNLRKATTASQKLATSQRAVTQATRTAAAQSIASGVGAGAGAGAAGAVAATKRQANAATAAATANTTLGRSFTGVGTGAAMATGALTKLIIPLGILMGSKGLGSAANSAVRFADEIGKTAGKLGVTTDGLQEFRFQAGQAGVNVQTATMALQRFTRRAAEAAKDTGEAKEAFKTMGIQLTDTNGNLRDSQALLGDVSEAISKTESAGERLRLAFKLFDSEGVALVNTMLQGKEAYDAQARSAKNLGVIYDSHLIKQAEILANKLDIATVAMDVNFKQALISIQPLVTSTSNVIAAMAGEVGHLVDSLRPLEDRSLAGLDRSFLMVREAIDATRDRIAQLRKDIEGDKPFALDFITDSSDATILEVELLRMESLQKRFVKIRDLIRERNAPAKTGPPTTGGGGGTEVLGFIEDVEITNLIERLKTERIAAERAITMVLLSENEKRQAAVVHQFQDALIASKGDVDARLAAEQAFVKKLEALQAESAAEAVKTEKKLTEDILALINRRADAQEEYGEIQKEITRLVDAGTISTLQGARALEHYAEQLGLVEDRAEGANQRLSALGSTLSDDVLGAFSTALVDFDFSDVADSLIAANRSLLKGVIEEGLRPVLAGGFENISEGVGGQDTFLGKIFKGASDQALGVVGATEGEKLIIDAIDKTTDAVRGGGTRTGVEDGLEGMAVRAREDSIAIQQELAIQTTESRTGFANVSNRVIDMTNILPGLFGSLFSLLSGGSGASTLDKVLGMVGALAGAASQFTGGPTSGSSGTSPGTVTVGDFGAGFGAGSAGIAARGGVVGRSHFPSRRVASSVFAGAKQYQRGGVIGRNNVVPILAHRGELITPLEGGTLPVDIKNGVPEVRTPGGDRIPVDIRGERDIGPTVFAAGAIVIMAQPGERLDQTVGQAVEAAFTQGARSQRRNTGRAG